jgi:hypothetical protein
VRDLLESHPAQRRADRLLLVRQIRSIRPAPQSSPPDRSILAASFWITPMPKAVKEIRSLARAQTRTAIRTLAGIMSHPKAPPAARVAAANALLDRGWGKPSQTIAGDENNPLRVRIGEIVRTIVDPNPQTAVTAEAGNTSAEPEAVASALVDGRGRPAKRASRARSPL